MRGTIEGIEIGHPMAGVVLLVIRNEAGELDHVTCEASSLYRALAAEESYIGMEIRYTVDGSGAMTGFETVDGG